ncbi:MAG: flagellar basal body L-ring protein FlgH [Buchnera aphidicola (Nurudea yanoniella)]
MTFTFRIKYYLVCILFVTLNGCVLNPSKILNQDKSRFSDLSIIWPDLINNSNYKEQNTNISYFEPLFENYRPHNVGDTLIVVLKENVSASQNLSNNLTHDGSTDLGITFGTNHKNNNYENQAGLNGFSKNDFTGKGSLFANNTFVGLITVTVRQVFPNGNLEVSGEKKISINDEKEKIRFSGIVNPRNISKDNSIISTQIANSRIEYISDGFINKGLRIGWFQRLFLSILSI